jgi:hypothetical protein
MSYLYTKFSNECDSEIARVAHAIGSGDRGALPVTRASESGKTRT